MLVYTVLFRAHAPALLLEPRGPTHAQVTLPSADRGCRIPSHALPWLRLLRLQVAGGGQQQRLKPRGLRTYVGVPVNHSLRCAPAAAAGAQRARQYCASTAQPPLHRAAVPR